jgi:hypothetical protein
MTYKTPAPSVTKVLVQPSQNLVDSQLLPCLIGPLNQVVKSSPITLVYPVANATIAYPGMKPGAIINTSSINIVINNAVIQINATPLSAGANFVAGVKTVNIADAFTKALAGDIITLSAAGGVYTIATVVDKDHVILVETIYHTTSAETFNITRNIASAVAKLNTVVYHTTFMTVTSMTYGTDNFVFVDGDAVMSYIAARKDLLGFYTVNNADTLAADMDIDILNPLGFDLGIAMAGAGAATRLAYITRDGSQQAYIDALEDLAVRRGPYMISSVNFADSTIQGFFATHATVVSQPSVSMFRAALLTTNIVQQLTKATATYTKPS